MGEVPGSGERLVARGNLSHYLVCRHRNCERNSNGESKMSQLFSETSTLVRRSEASVAGSSGLRIRSCAWLIWYSQTSKSLSSVRGVAGALIGGGRAKLGAGRAKLVPGSVQRPSEVQKRSTLPPTLDWVPPARCNPPRKPRHPPNAHRRPSPVHRSPQSVQTFIQAAHRSPLAAQTFI